MKRTLLHVHGVVVVGPWGRKGYAGTDGDAGRRRQWQCSWARKHSCTDHLREADDETAELRVDVGVVLEAGLRSMPDWNA
jgi:hypothetical protein